MNFKCTNYLRMDLIFKILLFTHIPAGFIGLILFWIPVLAKKGSKLHVQVGKAYVFLMWIVVVTAAIMCCIRAYQGELIVAAFLGFISILTGQPLWYAISIIKHKKDVPMRMLKLKKLLSVVLFFSGLGLLIWGVNLKMEGPAILLVIFGIIGLTAANDAFGSIQKAKENSNWLREHIGGMIVTGIASHTAFFAFGGATFFQAFFAGPLIAIPWTAPTIVGTIIIMMTNRKYGVA